MLIHSFLRDASGDLSYFSSLPFCSKGKEKILFSAPSIISSTSSVGSSFGQLSSFEHVVLLQVDSLDNLKEYGLTNIEDTLIYVQNDFSRPKDVCKTIIKENPGLQDFEKPFSSEYMEVYHDW